MRKRRVFESYWRKNGLTAVLLMAAMATGLPAAAQRPTDGLVGHWRFEETSGTTAASETGSNNAVLVDSPGLDVVGEIGSAISFVGNSGYAEVAEAASLDISGSLTIDFWIKVPTDWPTGAVDFAALFGKGDDTYQLRRNGATFGLRFDIRNRGLTPAVDTNLNTTTVLVPDTWTHVAATFDAGTGDMKVYFGGVEDATTANHTEAVGTNDLPLQIGANFSGTAAAPAGTYRRFSGVEMDEVALYNRALTAAEVSDLAAGTPAEGEGEGEPQGNAIVSNIYPPYIDEGTTIILTAPEGTDYQWRLDDVDISGATDREFSIASVAISDEGAYSVRYNDGTEFVASEIFELTVSIAGSVPVAGGAALALLASLTAIGGARRLRRRNEK